jgi:hypothetical protein
MASVFPGSQWHVAMIEKGKQDAYVTDDLRHGA